METKETNIDERIKYFLHLPAHIKGTVAALDNVGFKEPICSDLGKPAHVVNGSITTIGGRMNIPDINTISRLYVINEDTLLFN